MIASLLLCGVVFGLGSAREHLAQTRTDHLQGAAQAVSAWVSAAHQARLSAALSEPDKCRTIHHQPLAFCFAAIASPGQPFASLENSAVPDPAAPTFAFIAASAEHADGQPCSQLPDQPFLSGPRGTSRTAPQSWAGLILVQNTSFMDDLSVTVNRLNIGYCDRDQIVRWVSRSAAF